VNGKYQYKAWLAFLGGLALGALLYHTIVTWQDSSGQQGLAYKDQQELIEELQMENQELFDELFRTRNSSERIPGDDTLPYDADADARQVVSEARIRAVEENKFLMVIFGANWCHDCRNLHRKLKGREVQEYSRDLFIFANVDVGKLNQNVDVATELGVSLKRGIPVAIIYNPEGQVIGTTNEGQLEPSRHYSSKQILKFVRDVAQRSRIQAPDAVN
jgi:thioredoxin-related protein